MNQQLPQLPFLAAVCWQTDINTLTPAEMLRRYERGWHYRGILGELSTQEAAFVRELTQRYGSWIVMNFELEQHRHILQILSRLNGDFLKDCGAYFGYGTFLSLKYDEYRLSKDIDFLCSSSQGYRAIRQQIFDRGYDAIFISRDGIDLIDLAILRYNSEIPQLAIAKAENAYPVIEPLKRAIVNFQTQPEYRQRCYQSLMVKSPAQIIDGIDKLAADFHLPVSDRTFIEQAEH